MKRVSIALWCDNISCVGLLHTTSSLSNLHKHLHECPSHLVSMSAWFLSHLSSPRGYPVCASMSAWFPIPHCFGCCRQRPAVAASSAFFFSCRPTTSRVLVISPPPLACIFNSEGCCWFFPDFLFNIRILSKKQELYLKWPWWLMSLESSLLSWGIH